MENQSILDICFPCVLTREVLEQCNQFSCGDDDMDEFFYHDALDYARYRMGKSYCFRLIEDPAEIVACFTVSNDSIRIFDLGSSRKNRMWKEISNREKRLSRYPGVLIGRLAVSSRFAKQGIGSEIIRFVREWFAEDDNKSGCRLAIVDAKNDPQILSFYKKNHFKFLFQSEADEYSYMHQHEKEKDKTTKLESHIATRLMYCDLLA